MKKNSNADIVFLAGKRINLRPVDEKDIDLFLRWFNDQEVTKYLLTYLPKTRAEEKRWIEGLSEKKGDSVVLTIIASGIPIGNIALHKINTPDQCATLGITIGDKNFWSKGYGTEAITVLLHYAFYTLNLRKVCLSVIDFNGRAISCYEKCGFKEEGRLKEQLFREGSYRDEVLMSVFRKDWKPPKK